MTLRSVNKSPSPKNLTRNMHNLLSTNDYCQNGLFSHEAKALGSEREMMGHTSIKVWKGNEMQGKL